MSFIADAVAGVQDQRWRKARKKPVIIEFREVEPETHIRTHMPSRKEVWGEVIETLEGILEAYPDKHFIIRGVRGEVYPIEKTIFNETYEVIEDGPPATKVYNQDTFVELMKAGKIDEAQEYLRLCGWLEVHPEGNYVIRGSVLLDFMEYTRKYLMQEDEE
jgi:hypothetical protein